MRKVTDGEGIRQAWAAVESAWAETMTRVESMHTGTVDISVSGEWSFAETLRHLVMATDVWFRGAILGIENPYHPVGVPHVEYGTDGLDLSVFSNQTPTYEEVLAARSERQSLVRDFLSTASEEELQEPRANPWAPAERITVARCIRTILSEEWEHRRFALRDLDAIASLEP